MRYIHCLIFVLYFSPVLAAEPYTAVITADSVTVRSGPGYEFYPTLHLRAGDKVEIYYKQGEWCAIRPPIGSFSWVSAGFVHFGSGNVGTVLADGLASRVGSDYSDDCDTVQVTLKKGEPVLILERRKTPENAASPVWLKIAPPSGEFRWIHRSAIQPFIQQVRYDASATEVAVIEAPTLPKIAATHPFSTTLQHSTANVSTADPFQRAFEELQRETYIVMTRPTDDEVFVILIQRARELHQIAPTDHALEKTYHLLESLQRTRAVRRELALRRPAASGMLPNPRTVASPTTAGVPASQQSILQAYTPTSAQSPLPVRESQTVSTLLLAGVNVGGYDIVGRLGEFDHLPPGHPPYAVVDEKGQIICLISPSPNLNLSQRVGHFVGINGVLGEYHQQGRPPARHITARNIQTLR